MSRIDPEVLSLAYAIVEAAIRPWVEQINANEAAKEFDLEPAAAKELDRAFKHILTTMRKRAYPEPPKPKTMIAIPKDWTKIDKEYAELSYLSSKGKLNHDERKLERLHDLIELYRRGGREDVRQQIGDAQLARARAEVNPFASIGGMTNVQPRKKAT